MQVNECPDEFQKRKLKQVLFQARKKSENLFLDFRYGLRMGERE